MRPVLLVLAAIASVQFGAATAATLFDEVGPGGAVFLRLVLSAALLVAIWRPRLRGHRRGELALAAAFGLVLAAMNSCFYLSLDRIPLGIAVTFEFVDPLGVAFALLAGCLWAAYILLSARVGRAFPGGTGLAVALLVGAAAVVPFGLVSGGAGLLDGEVVALGVAVAVLSSAIAYSLELEALRRMATAVFGVLMSLEPAVGALAGFVVLDQEPSGLEGLAIALVVAASAGVAWADRAAVRD